MVPTQTSRKMRKAPATAGTGPGCGPTTKELDVPNITPDTPTELLQAKTGELVDELLRRGMGVEELCCQLGVSQDEMFRLLGRTR
jgi:hypothetical protein